MVKIGIADTTFSRVNMFDFVEQQLTESGFQGDIERFTVPGIKDLPVACQKLFQQHNCDLVIALGMPGPEKIDKTCSHEASLSIQRVQLSENKFILEVFVHMDEAKTEEQLYSIAEQRTKKHVLNALALLESKTVLSEFAGKGRRQGFSDEGQIKPPFSKTIKLGLVVSDYNSDITHKMKSTALIHAERLGMLVKESIHVSGVLDAPLAVKFLLKEKDINAVIVLGAVIKGETFHDEVVAFTCADKVFSLSLEFNKPVAFGVSGPGISKEQAVKRIESYARHSVESVFKSLKVK